MRALALLLFIPLAAAHGEAVLDVPIPEGSERLIIRIDFDSSSPEPPVEPPIEPPIEPPPVEPPPSETSDLMPSQIEWIGAVEWQRANSQGATDYDPDCGSPVDGWPGCLVGYKSTNSRELLRADLPPPSACANPSPRANTVQQVQLSGLPTWAPGCSSDRWYGGHVVGDHIYGHSTGYYCDRNDTAAVVACDAETFEGCQQLGHLFGGYQGPMTNGKKWGYAIGGVPEDFCTTYLEGMCMWSGGSGAPRESAGGNGGPGSLYAWRDPPDGEQITDSIMLLGWETWNQGGGNPDPSRYPGGRPVFAADTCASNGEMCAAWQRGDRWHAIAWFNLEGYGASLLVAGRHGRNQDEPAGNFGHASSCYGTRDQCAPRNVSYAIEQGFEHPRGPEHMANAKGTHGEPYEHVLYFYSEAQLAEVALGVREPWDVEPYAWVRLDNMAKPESAGACAGDPIFRTVDGVPTTWDGGIGSLAVIELEGHEHPYIVLSRTADAYTGGSSRVRSHFFRVLPR